MAEYKKDEDLKEGELPPALKAAIEKKKGKKMDDEEGKDDEDEDKDDDEDEDKKEVKEKKHAKMKEYKEDIDAIFSDENLSEDFKKNAQAIFEAAVLARVADEKSALEEEYEAKLEEQVGEFASTLVDKIDEYLDYVVSEWAEENKVAIANNIKAEIAEDFMVGLKNLFVENYIDIPEDKVDLVGEFAEKLSKAEEDLDKMIGENADLVSQLVDYKKEKIVSEITEGLSDVQSEKLKSLAENIEFVSEEDYKEKLSLTKKKYFETVHEDTKPTEKGDGLDSDASTIEESYTPYMEKYVRNISKIVKR
jgi:hypothetical protein